MSEPTIVNREILLHALDLTKRTNTNKTSDIAASRVIPIASALRVYGNDDGQLVIQRGPIRVVLRNVFSTLPLAAVADLDKQVKAFKKGTTIELSYEPEFEMRKVRLEGEELGAMLTHHFPLPDDPGDRPTEDFESEEYEAWRTAKTEFDKVRTLHETGPSTSVHGSLYSDEYKDLKKRYDEVTMREVEVELPRIKVSAGKRNFTIKGYETEDLPTYPEPDDAACQALADRDDFLYAISTLKPIMSNDETRPVLKAASFEFGEESTLVVATDSYRLGKRTLPSLGEENAFDGQAVIIDKGDLLAAEAVFKKSVAGDMLQICGVRVKATNLEGDPTEGPFTAAIFRGVTEHADVSILMRLVDGNFPEWRRLWPHEDALTRSELNRNQLVDAIKAAQVITGKTTPPIPVVIEPDESTVADGVATEVTVSAYNLESGETFAENIETGCDGWSVDSKFALNPNYMLDSLNLYTTDRVSFGVQEEGTKAEHSGHSLKPIIIGEDGLNMPMRDPRSA